MRPIVAVVTWVALFAGFVVTAGCGKKVEIPPEPAATTSAPPVAELPTQQAMIAAMLRGHPNSRQVCVDGVRDRAFFLDYGPLLPPGTDQNDGRFHGWLFIEKVDFYKTSNETWFILNQAENKYIQAYPDVAGLACKPQ